MPGTEGVRRAAPRADRFQLGMLRTDGLRRAARRTDRSRLGTPCTDGLQLVLLSAIVDGTACVALTVCSSARHTAGLRRDTRRTDGLQLGPSATTVCGTAAPHGRFAAQHATPPVLGASPVD
jgi:hypothetical protein